MLWKPPTPRQKQQNEFWEAVADNDVGKINAMLDADGTLINDRLGCGGDPCTPIHVAAGFNGVVGDDLSAAKLLIERGADVNMKDTQYQRTPLHLSKNLNLSKLLVDNGADVEAKNIFGQTPLNSLVSDIYSSIPQIDLLLEHGADINSQNSYGNTPIMWQFLMLRRPDPRFKKKYEDTARYLIKRGADVNIPNKDGETPLTYATGDLAKIVRQAAMKGTTELVAKTPLKAFPGVSNVLSQYMLPKKTGGTRRKKRTKKTRRSTRSKASGRA